MEALKIIDAHITAQPQKLGDPMPKVIITLEGQAPQELFEYYPDEISFTAKEFLGLTMDEARALKGKKDREYLKS